MIARLLGQIDTLVSIRQKLSVQYTVHHYTQTGLLVNSISIFGRPDIYIVAYALGAPGGTGIQAVGMILATDVTAKIIGTAPSAEYEREFLDAGAKAFVLANCSEAEWEHAIQKVLAEP